MPLMRNSITLKIKFECSVKIKFECSVTICKNMKKTLQNLQKLWMHGISKKTELQRGTKKDLMKDARDRNGNLPPHLHDPPPTTRRPIKSPSIREQRSAAIIRAS